MDLVRRSAQLVTVDDDANGTVTLTTAVHMQLGPIGTQPCMLPRTIGVPLAVRHAPNHLNIYF
jgi:hypothetical protein